MNKMILMSAILASQLLAKNIYNFPIPLQNKYLSVDHNGSLSTIQAYRDGVGIFTSAEFGKNIDNSQLNTLVYKYGEEAETLNITIKDLMLNGSYPNEDKILGLSISKFNIEDVNSTQTNGTICNDNNAKTINDIYMNGICVGTNVEGQICNDNNAKTINDIYINGICIGTNVEGQICNDNNAKTINDIYINGICVGTNVEGQACDDNDPVTQNDIYINGICKGIVTSNVQYKCLDGYVGNIDGNVLCTDNTDVTQGLFGGELLTGWNNFISASGLFYLYNTLITNTDNLTNFTGATWVQFEDNIELVSLAGLTSFTEAGRLEIFGNIKLTTLHGLESLRTVTGFFNLSDNDLLTDVSALSGVNSVDPAQYFLYFTLPTSGSFTNKISASSALCTQLNNSDFYNQDKRLICNGYELDPYVNLN